MSTEQTLTPAQELRAAASKIRETAKATTYNGPWWHEYGQIVAEDGLIAEVFDGGDGDAEHIALWHPGVAKLVAGWLWAVAIDCESDAETYNHIKERSTALSVARAINGGAR